MGIGHRLALSCLVFMGHKELKTAHRAVEKRLMELGILTSHDIFVTINHDIEETQRNLKLILFPIHKNILGRIKKEVLHKLELM